LKKLFIHKYEHQRLYDILEIGSFHIHENDSNGKYKIVEKDRDQKEQTLDSQTRPLSVEDRLLRLERIVLDPRK
jgi:hypothetical protein